MSVVLAALLTIGTFVGAITAADLTNQHTTPTESPVNPDVPDDYRCDGFIGGRVVNCPLPTFNAKGYCVANCPASLMDDE